MEYTVSTKRVHIQIEAKDDDEALEKAQARLKELLSMGMITLTITKKQ